MTNKEKELLSIDETQDYYVEKLIEIINGNDTRFHELKEIDFTSPTGTGKTVMVSKLINRLPEYFFVVTTLSRGQLRVQIDNKIKSLVKQNNFIVYGLNEYTKNTHLQEKDIINSLPKYKKIIWIRDEGHIATNRWQEVLKSKSSHIINFSATNKYCNGIQCNFTHTMMLRTVSQNIGTPEDALDKLEEVKKAHLAVADYNPCALFRLFYNSNVERVINECEKRGLKYINITNEDFNMEEICKDDNQYDVIINKLKITEGIDLKRCHVIYMDNKPTSESTVVQIIGRARRNALFWRNDIDILAKGNEKLLEQTRRCYIYYNVPDTKLEQSQTGELSYSLCDIISIERLKPDTDIYVKKGQMRNGLSVIELEGKTGKYHISVDKELHFNVVDNNDFYKVKSISTENNVLDLRKYDISIQSIGLKNNAIEYFRSRKLVTSKKYDINKYFYFLYKKHLERTKPSVLEELENRRLEFRARINDPYHLCDDRILRSVFMELDIYFDYSFFKHSVKKEFSLSERQNAYDESKILPPPYDEKKWILESYFGIGKTLGKEFLNYVDWVEYYDYSSYEKLDDFLEQSTRVVQIGVDEYKVFSHPLTKYLKWEGIKTLDDLKQKISITKGNYILKAKTSLWKKMISEINTFDDIDNYDSKIVNLSTLNDMFSIGLLKREIKTIIASNYPLIKCSADEFVRENIYEVNKKNGIPKKCKKQIFIYKNEVETNFKNYTKIINDKEIGTIGPDNMKYSNGKYIEDKPVSSKIDSYCKFNRFIESKYKREIDECKSKLFNGENNFGFDKLCNSCLGFCVEYYSKMIVYGDKIFRSFIDDAMREAKSKEINDIIRVRAAFLAYKYEMTCCFGDKVVSVIPNITIEKMIENNYVKFINTVVELGNKAAKFVKQTMYANETDPLYNIDPNLSVEHISALCDFISEDTILDLKCTSSINLSHIKQVLAYHYLSTKRSDIEIRKVVVYDAVSDKSVIIELRND